MGKLLPVDHDPFSDDDVPPRYPLAPAPHAPPGVGSTALNAPLPNQNTFPDAPVADRLFGLNGVPRYQLFPERAARGLANSLGDLMTNDPWDPATGNLRTGAIEDSTDIAMMLAGSPAVAARPGIATLGSGAVRGARAAEAVAPADAAVALPMDQASRLARAREMGFRSDLPLYHGSGNSFSQFTSAPTTQAGLAAPGVSTALDPAVASEFAVSRGGQPQVYPLLHRTQRPAVLDLQGDESHGEVVGALRDAFDSGHDAVMLRNYTTPGGRAGQKVVIVRDANQLRSPSAAFDPAKRLSPNLLAGIAGAAVLPPAAMLLQPVDHDPFGSDGQQGPLQYADGGRVERRIPLSKFKDGSEIGLAQNPPGVAFQCRTCKHNPAPGGICKKDIPELYGRKIKPLWCCSFYDHKGMKVIV